MQCQVCWHHCELKEGQIGSCRARINKDGVIVSLNYGQLVSLALDPIEKKPLARFMPGSYILSLGSFGCNMHCTFCQNYAISQMGAADLDSEYYSPEDILSLAQRDREQGNVGVAFTYNEPMIGYEYVRDTAKIIKQAGMVNVVVTNGCVEQPILAEVLPYIDAFTIDLKSFKPEVSNERFKLAIQNYIGSGEKKMMRTLFDMGDIEQIIGHGVSKTAEGRMQDIIEMVENTFSEPGVTSKFFIQEGKGTNSTSSFSYRNKLVLYFPGRCSFEPFL